MKLYEINNEILRLTDAIQVDAETGELLGSSEQFIEEINTLQMERQAVLEYLAKLVLNLRADESALKAEEDRLRARRDGLSRKRERLMDVLDRECDGQKTDLGVATLKYRQTSKVDVTDGKKAAVWLMTHGYHDCVRVKAPEIAKAQVKKLLTEGAAVPGCQLINDRSCSLS